MSSSNLREMLTGVEPQFKIAQQAEPSETLDRFKPFAYASLRLCKTCVIFSKVLKKEMGPAHQALFSEEVNIGMLSTTFLAESCSKFVAAPIATYKVVPSEESGVFTLRAVTPMADKFLQFILQYTQMFDHIDVMKQFILNEMPSNANPLLTKTGNSIFLYDLEESLQETDSDILYCPTGQPPELPSLETSFSQFLLYSFL
mmetsp:Transcript_23432/g.36100  ORF Transcript_23432/g.36100 Transcript_23432/m.36100 type:complete len:201 (+) Transcript_23432:1270-1872(+)